MTLLPFIVENKKEIYGDTSLSQRNNYFSEVKIKTHDKRGKEINLKSDDIYETKKDNYTLKNIVSTFTLSNGEVGTISADVSNAIRGEKTECEFIGNVILSTESGLLIKTEELLVDFNKKTASGNAAVAISRDNVTVSAKKYFFSMEENVLTLADDAKGFFKSDKVSSNKMIIRFDAAKNIQSVNAIGNAVYISKNYQLKAKSGILYYPDKALAQEDVVLLYRKDGNDYNVRSDAMRARIVDGKLNNIEANGSLIIKTKDVTIRANKGILENDLIRVFGNVAISNEHGNVFGSAATLDTKTGDVSLDKSSGIVNDGIH
jgi:lipopolysaccharide export system protein LptA